MTDDNEEKHWDWSTLFEEFAENVLGYPNSKFHIFIFERTHSTLSQNELGVWQEKFGITDSQKIAKQYGITLPREFISLYEEYEQIVANEVIYDPRFMYTNNWELTLTLEYISQEKLREEFNPYLKTDHPVLQRFLPFLLAPDDMFEDLGGWDYRFIGYALNADGKLLPGLYQLDEQTLGRERNSDVNDLLEFVAESIEDYLVKALPHPSKRSR